MRKGTVLAKRNQKVYSSRNDEFGQGPMIRCHDAYTKQGGSNAIVDGVQMS